MATLLMLLLLTHNFTAQTSPKFMDHPVAVYTGKLHNPKWIRKVGPDEWRDRLDKLTVPPEVNFAGKYFVAVHSCGTQCRYYSMTDLTTGRDLDLLSDFGSADPPPKTRDGHTYIADLITLANSKMLVAQYYVQFPGDVECRERTFVFEDGKITPITGTRRTCTKY